MFPDKGMNNSAVRIENKRKLTKLLYKRGALTRQELVRQLNLSAPTVNGLVQLMEEEYLVFYTTAEQVSTGGRIPNQVCFKYDAFYSVGIQLNDSHYCILLTDMKCNVVDVLDIAYSFEDTIEYWTMLSNQLEDMISRNGISKDKILGLGVAVPGPAFHKVKKMDSWLFDQNSFSCEKLEDIFGLHIIFENDANAAGFSEIWVRDDVEEAAYLWVSKGVGGAIIRKNAVVHGQDNLAGEFGHMIIQPHGRQCLCGRKGCFDRYCSVKLLSEQAGGSLERYFEIKNEKPELQEYWENYLDYLAIGISNIAITLDIPVIIGGEITPYLSKEFDALKKRIVELDSFGRSSEKICMLSHVGENSAAIGAALLIVSEYLGIS